MSFNTEHIIDEYLLNRLRGDALNRIKHQIEHDPVFALEVQQRKTMIAIIEAYGDFELKKYLQRIHRQELKRNLGLLKMIRKILFRHCFLVFPL